MSSIPERLSRLFENQRIVFWDDERPEFGKNHSMDDPVSASIHVIAVKKAQETHYLPAGRQVRIVPSIILPACRQAG